MCTIYLIVHNAFTRVLFPKKLLPRWTTIPGEGGLAKAKAPNPPPPEKYDWLLPRHTHFGRAQYTQPLDTFLLAPAAHTLSTKILTPSQNPSLPLLSYRYRNAETNIYVYIYIYVNGHVRKYRSNPPSPSPPCLYSPLYTFT